MERNIWSELIVENRATPRRIDKDAFREWMAEQQIFVSSVMDDEMIPARRAVQQRISDFDGNPVMWEMLAPRDQHPERAFLEGVERSDLFVLLLGHRYGVSDDSGFSPTHKEANHAEFHQLYRMMFQPNGVVQSKRDGKLNDWVRSLYNQISGGTFESPKGLANQIERHLFELACEQEAIWVKLGALVFPGKVESYSSGGRTTVTITARVRQYSVRSRFAALSTNQPRSQLLTWGGHSYRVNIEEVQIASRTASEDEVTVICQPQAGYSAQDSWALAGVTMQLNGRAFPPVDQVRLWTKRAVLGQQVEEIDDLLRYRLFPADERTLPEVLQHLNASGWFAAGVTRLFVVEQLSSRFGAKFHHIEIGSASAAGIRVDFTFSLDNHEPTPLRIAGIVPLS